MPNLKERPGEIQPQNATRCHEGKLCFFAHRDLGSNMVYGDSSGRYCGGQDLASGGRSFHYQTSPWVNNTNCTVRVYQDSVVIDGGVSRTQDPNLFAMPSRSQNAYVGDNANDKAVRYDEVIAGLLGEMESGRHQLVEHPRGRRRPRPSLRGDSIHRGGGA